MLTTIDFDDDVRTMAREIDDVAPEAYLPTKMCCLNGKAVAQMPPKLLLSVRRRRAHFARQNASSRNDAAIADSPDARLLIAYRHGARILTPTPTPNPSPQGRLCEKSGAGVLPWLAEQFDSGAPWHT